MNSPIYNTTNRKVNSLDQDYLKYGIHFSIKSPLHARPGTQFTCTDWYYPTDLRFLLNIVQSSITYLVSSPGRNKSQLRISQSSSAQHLAPISTHIVPFFLFVFGFFISSWIYEEGGWVVLWLKITLLLVQIVIALWLSFSSFYFAPPFFFSINFNESQKQVKITTLFFIKRTASCNKQSALIYLSITWFARCSTTLPWRMCGYRKTVGYSHCSNGEPCVICNLT